jgi:hypothetical protein
MSTNPIGVATTDDRLRGASSHASLVGRMMLRHVRQSSFVSLADESCDSRLMSSEVDSVDFWSGGVQPLVSCAAVAAAGSILPVSCVGPTLRPFRVSPFEHTNRWQCFASVSQGTEWQDGDSDGSEAGHACAVELFAVEESAVAVSGESLARLDVERLVAPVKQVRPPDPVRVCLRPLSGAWTGQVNRKRRALRMRGRKAGGKSAGTVAAYTALFLRDLAAFSAHGVQSSDLLVIERYVEGIEMGHVALYTVMFGRRKLLLYDTLQEAIDAASLAEASLKVSRMSHSSPAIEALPHCDRKVALCEQNEVDRQEDTVSAASPPQSPSLNARINDMYDEGLASCGPPSEDGMQCVTELSRTQECQYVKRSWNQCGGDSELDELDERSAGDECLLPPLAGDGRLWSSGGAMWSTLSPVVAQLVFGVMATGVVEVHLTFVSVSTPHCPDSSSTASAQEASQPQRQPSVSMNVCSPTVTVTEGCDFPPLYLVAHDRRVGQGFELQGKPLVVVTKTTGTGGSSLRLPGWHCSACKCAELEDLTADTSTSMLVVSIPRDDPAKAVSANTEPSSVQASAPLVPLSLTAKDGVLLTLDVNAGKALWDSVEDLVHAVEPIRGPGPDGGYNEDEREAFARIGKQGEWNRPSSTDFVSGTASVAVIDENKGSQALAVVTSLCGRGAAAGVVASGIGTSVLMSVGSMGPVTRANGKLLNSSGAPDRMSTDVCPKAELQAVAGSHHDSRTIAGRACFVSSQLEAAEACVRLMGALSGIAFAWLLLDIHAVVRETKTECGKKEEGNRPFLADIIAASVESVQSPTVMAVFPLSEDDVRLRTHRLPAFEVRLVVDRWTCNGCSAGQLDCPATHTRPMVVEGGHQRAKNALASMHGDVFGSSWATRVIDDETLRVDLLFVDEKGASPTGDEERRCSPEGLHFVSCGMIAAGEAAVCILCVGTSLWCGLVIVVVRKDQYGVWTAVLCIVVACRRLNARVCKDDQPSSLAVEMSAERRSVIEPDVVDLTESVGAPLGQVDLDPRCHDCGAVWISDGLEEWKATPCMIARAPATCLGPMQRVSMSEAVSMSVLAYIVDVLVLCWEAKQRLEQRDLPAAVNAVAVVADAWNVIIQERRVMFLHSPCSGMREVQRTAAGTAELTRMARSAHDTVVDFERRWPSELSGYHSVEVKNEGDDGQRSSAESAATAGVTVDVCDGRKFVMMSLLASCRGRYAARVTAANMRNGLGAPRCYGPCRRLRAELPADSEVSDAPSRECCVWGRGLWAKSPVAVQMCVENVSRAVQDFPRAYVEGGRKDRDRPLAAAVDFAINGNRQASTGYIPHCLSHDQEVRSLPIRNVIAVKDAVTVSNVPAASSALTDMVSIERVEWYVLGVGEWPGRLQYSRPLPVRVANDGAGEHEESGHPCVMLLCMGEESGTVRRSISQWTVEWNVWPLAELEGPLAVFVDGMVLWRGSMKYSKSQELSNLLMIGLESKDSRS